MQCSQEHLKTMVYAEFGGQTECIMGNWKIENNAKERVSRFKVPTPGWHLCHWSRSFTDNKMGRTMKAVFNLKQCNFNFKLLNFICSLMSLTDYGSLNLVGPLHLTQANKQTYRKNECHQTTAMVQ